MQKVKGGPRDAAARWWRRGSRHSTSRLIHAVVMQAAVLAGLLVGCMRSDQPVHMHLFESGMHAAIGEDTMQFRLVENKTEFATLYDQIHATVLPRPEPPSLDFDSAYVLAAFMGRRSTGGYSIVFHENAYWQGERVTVTVGIHAPPADAVVPQVITAPYSLALLPKGDYRQVEVLSTAGERLAVLEAP